LNPIRDKSQKQNPFRSFTQFPSGSGREHNNLRIFTIVEAIFYDILVPIHPPKYFWKSLGYDPRSSRVGREV
jgi:hypothetical protein